MHFRLLELHFNFNDWHWLCTTNYGRPVRPFILKYFGNLFVMSSCQYSMCLCPIMRKQNQFSNKMVLLTIHIITILSYRIAPMPPTTTSLGNSVKQEFPSEILKLNTLLRFFSFFFNMKVLDLLLKYWPCRIWARRNSRISLWIIRSLENSVRNSMKMWLWN